MGASAFRRAFKTRIDCSNEFISASIACRRRSWDSPETVSMKVMPERSMEVASLREATLLC